MMKDIEIKISRETRMVDLSKTTIGNDGENLQGNLVFSFTDEFVKGQGRLEYVINGESKYAFLLSDDENYYIPIKSVMTKEGQIDMQLVITEGTDVNEIPIFKSNVFYVSCKKSINAEVEEEEEYYSWIEIANTKLNEIDEVVEDIETKLANGEFDGKDGKDFTYEDFTEEQLENLRGPQGVPGEPGADGEDYVLTDEDKQEITNVLDEKYETYLDTITPKNTAKGELVHITDALSLPTFENKVDGNVEQEGEPSPTSPQEIEVLEAHNKFNINTITENKYIDGSTGEIANSSASNISDYIEIEANKKFTLLFKYNSLVNTENRVIASYDTNKNFLNGIVYNPANKLITFTTPNDAKFVRFSYDKNIYDIQLVKGTKEKLYLPYGHIGYKITGKNKLSVPFTQSSTNILITNIPNFEAGTYTFSFKMGTLASQVTARKIVNGTTTQIKLIYNANALTFDLDEDATLQLEIYKSGILLSDVSDVMLSKEGGEYEPYKEQIVYLDLKENWVGAINETIKDYLVTDKKKYWLVKNVGKVVLDGSETIELQSINSYGIANFLVMSSSWGIAANTYEEKMSVKSDYFKIQTTTISATQDEGVFVANQDTFYIRVKNSIASTVDEFKQWLSNNNVEVYYRLKEPQIIELGELPEPIKTFEGVNNIQLLANLDTEIEVKYALDVKKYYDNKLAEISAQII